VFEELLLDADWSVNEGTWLWLSCSSFLEQFFHCYCPVKFGRKADANGDYIRYDLLFTTYGKINNARIKKSSYNLESSPPKKGVMQKIFYHVPVPAFLLAFRVQNFYCGSRSKFRPSKEWKPPTLQPNHHSFSNFNISSGFFSFL
jgi:hypothetical protein